MVLGTVFGTGDELEDYHVIQGDVARTRRTLAFFKDEEVQGIMVNLLMFYCKRRGTPYTQGMNEVLAAFINLFVDELRCAMSLSRVRLYVSDGVWGL